MTQKHIIRHLSLIALNVPKAHPASLPYGLRLLRTMNPTLLSGVVAFASIVHGAIGINEYTGDSNNKDLPSSGFSTMLHNQLLSMGLSHYDNKPKLEHDLFLIPRHHVTDHVLDRLGYKDLIKSSKRFNFSSNALVPHLDIMIPEKLVPYFIFNTADPVNIPKFQTKLEYANFIVHSAPFELPKLSELIDYLLILPIPHGFKEQSLSSDMLTTSSEYFPMFKHAFYEGLPLMVFFFKSGENRAQFQKFGIQSMGTNASIRDKDLNKFFDVFAQAWIKDISYLSLIHSVFCTLSPEAKNNGFCIKIKYDMDSLVLFPAFELPQRKKGEDQRVLDVTNLDKKLPVQKRSEILKFNSQSHVNYAQVLPMEELIIPLSIMREDSDGPELYIPRSGGYADVGMKIKGRYEGEEEFAEAILKQKLVDGLEQKQLKATIKDKGAIYARSQMSEHKQESEDIASRARSNHRSSAVMPNEQRKSKFKLPIVEETDDIVAEWNEKLRNQKLSEKAKLQPFPRSHGKSNQIKGSDHCEPITWFNVFHHSIFGKTKFCGV